MNFTQRLRMKAQAQLNKSTILLPESGEEKILRAAQQVVALGVASPILLGNKCDVELKANTLGISLEGVNFIDYQSEEYVDCLLRDYLAISDQFSEKSLQRKLRDPLNFGAMAIATGKADCLAAGVSYSTGDVILAAQSLIGMREGIQTISSIGLVEAPGFEGGEESMFAITDCAVNPEPSIEQLADIAIVSADTVKKLLAWEPRVAMLSFSTKGSSVHPAVDKVVEAVALTKNLAPNLKVDGEFQLDAALIPKIAAKKVEVPSDVAGKANVLVFPDLGAGNIAVKVLQIFGHASAHGPLMQGFRKPVTDFSRSATVEELVGNITMLAILAQEEG